MTEGFFDHLKQHAVPLNETAIRQIRDSATALDLYTWLAYRLPRLSPRRPVTLSWQQLATHFGNDGRHIRKFRQTVRDAWDRQVSAVYPEARADFASSVVRLQASPPPLKRTLVPGAHLSLVTDDKGTPPPGDAAVTNGDATLAARFLARLAGLVGSAAARSWLNDATLELVAGEWVLLVGTRFTADWIRGHFDQPVRQAADAVGLKAAPVIRMRLPPAPSP